MMRSQDHNQHQQQSTVLYELSSLILNILRCPPSPAIRLSDQLPSPPSSEAPARRRGWPPPPQITPSGFASLMLGISLALMLCGSVTFFIGFLLLPWVVGLVMVFYFVGLVSSLTVLGRAFLCYATSPSSPPSPTKDIPAWKLL